MSFQVSGFSLLSSLQIYCLTQRRRGAEKGIAPLRERFKRTLKNAFTAILPPNALRDFGGMPHSFSRHCPALVRCQQAPLLPFGLHFVQAFCLVVFSAKCEAIFAALRFAPLES
jgi:hypothetical protein